MKNLQAIFQISEPGTKSREIIVGVAGLTVGRDPSNVLVFLSKSISQKHFVLVWQDDRIYLEDLKSRNGTNLNGVPLDPDIRQRLEVDDLIEIGPQNNPIEFRLLRIEEEPVSASSEEFEAPAGDVLEAAIGFSDEATIPDKESAGRSITVSTPLDYGIVPPPPSDNLPIALKDYEDIPGINPDKPSTWMQYLPEIYSVDDFIGRFLLIFESVFNPLEWYIDHFDMFLSPDTAPEVWIQWMASWFDVLVHPKLEVERQRDVLRQISWLFFRRGTKEGLERLLSLYFNVSVTIEEDKPCHFIVTLPLAQSNSALVRAGLGQAIAERIIISQKPAFARFDLVIR